MINVNAANLTMDGLRRMGANSVRCVGKLSATNLGGRW